MSKPTTRSKSDSATVRVYNSLTRKLGCLVPVPQLADKTRRPQREISFLPGNNEVPRAEWELCLKNKAFCHLLEKSRQAVGGGKFEMKTPLVEGKFDSGQAAEEAKLAERLEDERRKATA